MYLGFCGKAWEIEKEASMVPGQRIEVGGYSLTYKGSRREVDLEKQMIFADLDVERGGRALPQVNPAKFIYNESNMGPTTEVSQLNGLRDDLYVVLGAIDPESKRATFRLHVNPLVAWIWIGVLVLIVGAAISLWPDVSLREVGAWGYVRATAGVTSSVMFAILLASSTASAKESDRDRTRHRVEQVAPPDAASAPNTASPAAAEHLSDVTHKSGFSLLGGLLLGATLAWSTRYRRPSMAA
jgi:cytochrome c-type biogenesis protein CcmF